MDKLTEYMKCIFTDAEIAEFAKSLARDTQRMGSLDDEKKRVVSQFKADIDKVQAEINRVSNFIMAGCEYRNIECRVELDVPEQGQKTTFRCDTNEALKVQPMTDMDRQMRLELEDAAKAEEGKKDAPKDPIITRPPAPLRIDGPVVDIVPQHPEETAGPSLAPAPLMGGTHQRKRGRPRNADAEAYADGSAPDPEEK